MAGWNGSLQAGVAETYARCGVGSHGGVRAVAVVEAWGRMFVRFSLHVRITTSWGMCKREGCSGGRGFAASVAEGSAFAADFERALCELPRACRMMVLGVACLGLSVWKSARIAGLNASGGYRAYEKGCVAVWERMQAGGYGT